MRKIFNNDENDLNNDETFSKYFFKQFVFIIVNLVLFFMISYYYFPFILTTFFMWVAIVISILYLYLDLKFNFQIVDLKKQINSINNTIEILTKPKNKK